MTRKIEIPAKTSVVGRMDANNVILPLSKAILLFDVGAFSKTFGFASVKSHISMALSEEVVFSEVMFRFVLVKLDHTPSMSGLVLFSDSALGFEHEKISRGHPSDSCCFYMNIT